MSTSSLPDAEALYGLLLAQLRVLVEQSPAPIHLAGLASGGVWVARRLAEDLDLADDGVINVSFHRDDYEDKGVEAFKSAQGMATHIPFDVNGAHVVLVDDVLDTGRTVRAALNELFDYGRPAKVDLAVLADRYRRQLPVEASFKGAKVVVPEDEILVLHKNEQGLFHFGTQRKPKV